MNENLKWNIIQKYFEDNPKCLVKHHIDSFNDFFNYNIKQIFKEKNPIKILKQQDKKTKKFHEYDLFDLIHLILNSFQLVNSLQLLSRCDAKVPTI